MWSVGAAHRHSLITSRHVSSSSSRRRGRRRRAVSARRRVRACVCGKRGSVEEWRSGGATSNRHTAPCALTSFSLLDRRVPFRSVPFRSITRRVTRDARPLLAEVVGDHLLEARRVLRRVDRHGVAPRAERARDLADDALDRRRLGWWWWWSVVESWSCSMTRPSCRAMSCHVMPCHARGDDDDVRSKEEDDRRKTAIEGRRRSKEEDDRRKKTNEGRRRWTRCSAVTACVVSCMTGGMLSRDTRDNM